MKTRMSWWAKAIAIFFVAVIGYSLCMSPDATQRRQDVAEYGTCIRHARELGLPLTYCD